jgi:arylsulfatase A-like enzyme
LGRQNAITVFLVLVLLLACSPTGTKHPEDTDTQAIDTDIVHLQDANIVLIMADTLRARSTSLVSGERDITPNLAAWAENQVVFENAIAPAGWTPPCMASVFSGLYTSAHGLLDYRATERVDNDIFLEAIPTVPELYQSAGYQTAALIKSSVLPTDQGWGQGFDTWETVGDGEENMARQEAAREMTDAGLAWMDEHAAEGPFLLYLHYMDSHAPYQAPDDWRNMFVPESNSSAQDGQTRDVRDLYDGAAYTDADVEKLTALYDGEAAYWDSQFSRIPQYLDSTGLTENTIVVVFGDHGEQFAEHGSWLHYHLWQENIHVPLVVSVPGALPGRVSPWVSLIDLAPTLASLTGTPAWEEWQGQDHSAYFSDTTPVEPRNIYSEFSTRWAMIQPSGIKVHADSHEATLHDLASDPLETVDIRHDNGELFTELNQEHSQFLVQCELIRDRLED